MELLGLFTVLLVLYLLIAPMVALVRAGRAAAHAEEQQRKIDVQGRALTELTKQLKELREQQQGLLMRIERLAERPQPAAPADAAPVAPVAAAVAAATPKPAQRSDKAVFNFEPAEFGIAEPPIATPAAAAPPPDAIEFISAPEPAPPAVPTTAAPAPTWDLEPIVLPAASAAAESAPAEPVYSEAAAAAWEAARPAAVAAAKPEPPAEPKPVWKPKPPVGRTADSTSAPPPRRPTPPRTPREPSEFDSLVAKGLTAVKGWLFGGNLVAKIGLMILFIGVAFLLRLASNYVVVPIELRLAGIAAGAVALLGWGWRIRASRPGIALPAQGAALATLMLVSFGAFKIYHLLPAGPTFALLLALVAFTCLLAVLQDALWLAIFGIVGGFAVPILTSTGEGSHVALFSYYALLNAGILAIAWRRAWRSLNLLGFLFTFLIGTAWGVQRYEAAHYASSQAFLVLFLVFYVAIAVLYAWRQAPQLKSYVDGTLVFGVPTVAMGLQYGMVKDMHLGSALSALAFGLFYALVAAGLWRWRRGNLRLLVESFFALAVVFGTLAIPLAFDGRWTSAAWALEGAGIVWVGLRQRQPLVWRFGILVQLGSWLAFLRVLTGLDPLAALSNHISLGFALLGATGVFLALTFRRQQASDTDARENFGRYASVFIGLAVVWLLAGMWLEVWLRVSGSDRASLYVLTAIALVFALQWFGRRTDWRVPNLLAGAVTAVAGLTFLGLMARYMVWANVGVYPEQSLAEVLSGGALLGGALLSGGALVSAFAFKRVVQQLEAEVLDSASARASAQLWLLLAMFWWCGFALHGAAHALAWLTTPAAGGVAPWYAMPFWAGYSIGLALSAYGWMALTQRFAFPSRDLMLRLIWPAVTGVATWLYLVQVSPGLATEHWLDLRWTPPLPADGSAAAVLLALLGGALPGALILAALAWLALRRFQREASTPDLSADQRSSAIAIWAMGLGVVLMVPMIDALALASSQLLLALGASSDGVNAWLSYADMRLIWMSLAALALLTAARTQALPGLRWLALPVAVMQALVNGVVLAALYLDASLPTPGSGIALLLMWGGMHVCLSRWQQQWPVADASRKALHFGRVIAPWLMVAPVISLNLMPWLSGDANTQALADTGWVVAGMWPDYLAAWAAIALLSLGLRQVRHQGWPLAPLHAWYGNRVIPLAALWALLLVVYWNLRQDGSMAPLPYLPLLNPLDLTSAFVALMLADLWRLQRERLSPQGQRRWQRVSMALGFGWFNAMLLRTAAHYLGLPYRFEPLYQSQFVQAMLSLVWTLCAFALMRFAVRRLSKPLWMIGAALLGVVVVKLFLVDLKNVGSVARIVSFMGVGGLMLLIGYLAPLPREAEGDR